MGNLTIKFNSIKFDSLGLLIIVYTCNALPAEHEYTYSEAKQAGKTGLCRENFKVQSSAKLDYLLEIIIKNCSEKQAGKACTTTTGCP